MCAPLAAARSVLSAPAPSCISHTLQQFERREVKVQNSSLLLGKCIVVQRCRCQGTACRNLGKHKLAGRQHPRLQPCCQGEGQGDGHHSSACKQWCTRHTRHMDQCVPAELSCQAATAGATAAPTAAAAAAEQQRQRPPMFSALKVEAPRRPRAAASFRVNSTIASRA